MGRPKKQAPDPTRVLGYLRVSTNEQASTNLGLDAQRAAIRTECERRGWTLVEVITDAVISAKSLDRPGMARALAMLAAGEAGVLVVAKLDRATRSVMDAAKLLDRAGREGWVFVAIDLGLDPTTPSGELLANIMAAVAQWERRAIGARTREALAAKKAMGIRLGRPVLVPPEVQEQILKARRRGDGWSDIARRLNADRIPTAHGGARWYPSTVRAVVDAAEREMARHP